jgi:signal transduction histidine kinase
MMGFLTSSIPRKILASLVAIYVVTYVATAIVVYSGVRASIIQANTNALDQLADLKYGRLVNVIETRATDVTAWSQLEVMNDLVSGDIDKRVTRTLEGLKQLYGLAGDIYAFDSAGKLIASSRAGRAWSGIGQLPAEWRKPDSQLVLLDKHTDPVGGGPIIALEIPVFGSFDRTFRIGTLVLSEPWSTIEALLFSVETGTMLVETGNPPRILAADSLASANQAAMEPANLADGGIRGSLVAGRSAPRNGILGRWQVQAVQETGVVTRSLRRVGLELALLGAALSLPIFGLGRWLSNRLTAPVVELTRVVREIADTDKLDARVPVSSTDEFGTLARSFNRMTESLERATAEREQFVRDLEALNQTLEAKVAARTGELEEAVMAQQRLIGDISHEIKSPLARLGVALGLARRADSGGAPRQFDRMEREIGNISALASELLTLARLDGAASSIVFGPVELRALVGRIVTDAVYEAPARKGDVVLVDGGMPIVVEGNADLLRRAIENVVRNALFYTTAGTPVVIAIARKAEDLVSIEIHDEGPGVPDAALPHLFEPFYRVDEARTRKTGGSGIGLAICQRVVALHHGAVQARSNRPHGLVVAIDMPLVRRGADYSAGRGCFAGVEIMPNGVVMLGGMILCLMPGAVGLDFLGGEGVGFGVEGDPAIGGPGRAAFFDIDCAMVLERQHRLFDLFFRQHDRHQRAAALQAFGIEMRILGRDAVPGQPADHAANHAARRRAGGDRRQRTQCDQRTDAGDDDRAQRRDKAQYATHADADFGAGYDGRLLVRPRILFLARISRIDRQRRVVSGHAVREQRYRPVRRAGGDNVGDGGLCIFEMVI